jgi:hypothetical protein
MMDEQKSENNLTQELVESIGKIAGNNNCNNTNNISVKELLLFSLIKINELKWT